MAMMEVFGLSLFLGVVAGVGAVLNTRNVIGFLMCIELLFAASALNFVAFSNYYDHLDGQVMALLTLSSAACESAVALAVLIVLYRGYSSIDTRVLQQIKG